HEASAELAADMLTGEIASNDVLFDQMAQRGIPKDAAYATVSHSVNIGQAAARKEMGDAAYNELTRLADQSASIKKLVIHHGIQRAFGKAKGVKWSHVLDLARQFAGR